MNEENPPTPGETFTPITTQEELNKLIGGRIEAVKSKFADYDDLKTKAAEYDKGQEASKTELQKERERADAAEKKATETETRALRFEVGAAKGLTPAQAKRLVGSTKDELEKDADELLATFTPAKSKPNSKTLQSGSTGADGDNHTGKERAAAALRQLRGN